MSKPTNNQVILSKYILRGRIAGWLRTELTTLANCPSLLYIISMTWNKLLHLFVPEVNVNNVNNNSAYSMED